MDAKMSFLGYIENSIFFYVKCLSSPIEKNYAGSN